MQAQPIINYVVNKLGDYLLQEAILLANVKDDIEWMKRELRHMVGFLKDAEAKQKQHKEGVKEWIRDLTDIAYASEDVIENFLAGRFASQNSFSILAARFQIGHQIRDIKDRINELSPRRERYKIASHSESGGEGSMFIDEDLQARRKQSPYFDDLDGIVGLKEETTGILELLNREGLPLRVVSIVGMGGLGKTTLAKKVFYSSEVEQNFIVKAWVTVTPNFRVVDILSRTIKEVVANSGQNTEGMSKRSEKIIGEIATKGSAAAFDEEELKLALTELLKNRSGRFLLVFDDVWSKKLWGRIQIALTHVRNGSRVIFTTRFIDVGKSADPTMTPFELDFLNPDDSRTLFLKKIYPYSENIPQFPEQLEDVGQKLVNKCRRLPLALVILGGLISVKKKDKDVWDKVLAKLDWGADADVEECMKILGLSYEELPYNLKPCFLYVGSFPEDYHISTRQLIKYWVAECFTVPEQGRTGEETAERFLEELIQRCLVQVAERKYDGGVRTIRIHDLLRKLCLDKAEENMFLNVGSPQLEKPVVSSNVEATRRLAFHDYIHEGYLVAGRTKVATSLGKNLRTPNLRTLLIFGSTLLQHPISQYFAGLRLLRVIDVEVGAVDAEIGGVNASTLPTEIADMILLRYLRWIDRRSSVTLTASMVKLQNLNTFAVNAVIDDINQIVSLEKLQRLKRVIAEMRILKNLAKLTDLQKLEITIKSNVAATGNNVGSLEKFQSLVSLSLTNEAAESIPINFLKAFPVLLTLNLRGVLTDQVQFPKDLTKITLESSELGENAIAALGSLWNLRVLRLQKQSYQGEIMYFSRGFPRLRCLTLKHLFDLEEWSVATGTMPGLTQLIIHGCTNLKGLPSGLQGLEQLQEVKLIFMLEFTSRVHEGGADWLKIQHVPSIIIKD